MGDDTVRCVGGWIGRQRRLFPDVAEEIDPVTAIGTQAAPRAAAQE
jgi:hypothetical protein